MPGFNEIAPAHLSRLHGTPEARVALDGPHCTFDPGLRHFHLSTELLERLSAVIRGDTDLHDLAPQAAGCLAASVGPSRMFPDDLARLEPAMVPCDAPDRWVRGGLEGGQKCPTGRFG